MTALRNLLSRLIDWQVRQPIMVLAAVAAVTLALAVLASRLTLQTRYDALLPDNAPSVLELRRLERRASAAQTILVVLEGTDRDVLRCFGDELVSGLRALGSSDISAAEDGPHELKSFLEPRVGLFLERPELEKLERDIEARWDYEVSRATGSALDDDGPPSLSWNAIEMRLRDATRERGLDRFEEGYYERAAGSENPALVVVAHSPVAAGDLDHVGATLERVRRAVEAVRSASPERAHVAVSYAGDMPTSYREYGVVSKDLLSVGATGIALVLAAVLLYFLRVRAALVMAVTIAVGVTWTFGVTELVIGHLNVATAFLVSIVAGNGINVGILYQARYFEERRRGLEPATAVRTAILATWKPTAIAAIASAASYGSLLITDFRAFHEFGFIAATGMLACWVVKTLMVPPLLILVDRGPAPSPRGWVARHEMGYGRPFAWLAPRAPAVFAMLGALVAVVGTISAARFVLGDPMEYDLHKTETDASQSADLHHAWTVAADVLGASQGALAIATDSAAEATDLATALRARWKEAPKNDKPFARVEAISDLVPEEQQAKMPALLAIRDRVLRAHERGFLADADWTRLRALVPPEDLHPLSLDELPASVAGRFTDKNGVRGALVFIEADPQASSDLRRLDRFAAAFRETRLSSGRVVHGSGSAVILADMLRAVVRDAPRAIALSLALTLAMVFGAFRRGHYLASVLFAFAVGCGGVACFLYFADIKLNFLNFAALPITFGIGVDYAVNVAQRHEADEGHDTVAVLRSSGGAVVLCSLTTMLGYLALLGSHNGAIRSLGAIAAVGELSCLLAAVLILPALWLVRERTPRLGRPQAAGLTPLRRGSARRSAVVNPTSP